MADARWRVEAAIRGPPQPLVWLSADAIRGAEAQHRGMTQPVQPLPTPVTGREATTSLGAMVLAATARPRGPVLRTVRDAGPTLAGVELGRRIRDLARGLVALGIRPGDPVAVLGRTSLDWTLADCAVLAAGAVVVPIYHTNSPEETRYVLAHSGARAVICEDAAQVAKVAGCARTAPRWSTFIMTPTPGVLSLATWPTAGSRSTSTSSRIAWPGWAETTRRRSSTRPARPGPPKGCVLTHGNCLATLDMYERRLALASDAVVFVFLPLAHVLARVTQLVAISSRRHGRLLVRRPGGAPRGRRRGGPDAPAVGAAALREDPHEGHGGSGRRPRGQAPALHLGAVRGPPHARGRGVRARSRAGPARRARAGRPPRAVQGARPLRPAA